MTWFAVYDADEMLYSIGTKVANPLPEGFTVQRLDDDVANAIKSGSKFWDSASKLFIDTPQPVKIDRVNEIIQLMFADIYTPTIRTLLESKLTTRQFNDVNARISTVLDDYLRRILEIASSRLEKEPIVPTLTDLQSVKV